MNFIAWTTVAPPVAAGALAAGAAAPPPPPSEKAVGDWLTGGPATDVPPWPSYDFLQLLSGKAIEMVPAREGTTSEEAPMEIKENMAAASGIEGDRSKFGDASREGNGANKHVQKNITNLW